MILGKKEGKLYEENYENDVVYLFQVLQLARKL